MATFKVGDEVTVREYWGEGERSTATESSS